MKFARGNFGAPGSFFESISLTNKIIFANVIFYFASLLILGVLGEKFFLDNIALTPSLIMKGAASWTFLTSIFSHVMFLHVFANMFSLFFIGNFLEKVIGKKRFFWIYLASGILGGIFFVASGIIFSRDVPGIGASGAIFGLLGILAVLVPYSKIYFIAGPFILIVLEFTVGKAVPAGFAQAFGIIINILFFAMIFSLLSFNRKFMKLAIPIELPMWALPIIAIVPLTAIGFFVELPIGNSAHLGGLLAGLAYGLYLRQKFPRKTKMLSSHFR